MYWLVLGILLFSLSFVIKRNGPLYAVQTAFLWLVASCNTDNPDYVNYYNGYTNMVNYQGTIAEPLYWETAKFAKFLGCDYQGFRFILYGIAFAILAYAIWKLSIHPNCVLSFYFVYPFVMDVIQVRTLLSNALILVAICKLIEYNETRKIRYLGYSAIFIIIACGFHFSAISAVIIYLALINKELIVSQLPKLIGLAVVGLAVMFLYRNKIINKLISLGIIGKAGGYTTSGGRLGGYIICVFAFRILFAVLCILIMHAVRKNKADSSNRRAMEILYNCVLIYSLFGFGELLISMELERMSRIALICGLSLLSRASVDIEVKNYNLFSRLTTVYYGLYFYLMMFMHYAATSNWFEFTFLAVYQNMLI